MSVNIEPGLIDFPTLVVIRVDIFSFFMFRDPSQATSFIIPFDAGVHSYIDHLNGRPRLASPHGWTAIALLKEASKNEVSDCCLLWFLFSVSMS